MQIARDNLKKKLLITLLLSMLFGTSHNSHSEPLHVYCDNWPAFCQIDGNGIYFELVRVIYQPHGYVIFPHIVPYKRASAIVSRNGGDMMLGSYKGEIDNVLMPVYPDSADDIIVMMLNKWRPHWQGESSLEGESVLWPRGWQMDRYIPASMNWHEVDSHDIAMQLLKKERYRYYLTVGVLQSVSNTPTDIHREFIGWIPTYPAFGNHERGRKLQIIWDQEMPRLIKQDVLAELYRRYNLYDYYRDFLNELKSDVDCSGLHC